MLYVVSQYTERWSEIHCITEFLSQPTHKVFLTHPEFKPVTPLTQNAYAYSKCKLYVHSLPSAKLV